jgi:hypothetical protein
MSRNTWKKVVTLLATLQFMAYWGLLGWTHTHVKLAWQPLLLSLSQDNILCVSF